MHKWEHRYKPNSKVVRQYHAEPRLAELSWLFSGPGEVTGRRGGDGLLLQALAPRERCILLGAAAATAAAQGCFQACNSACPS